MFCASVFAACHNEEPSFFADDVPMDQCDEDIPNVEPQPPDTSNVDCVAPPTHPDTGTEEMRAAERAKGKK